ncbi:hypothetical protein VP01_9644g1, partial [Puccinia sorghi]
DTQLPTETAFLSQWSTTRRGHRNVLHATTIGTVILINQEGKHINLEKVLLGNRVMVEVDGGFSLQGTTKNNLLELVNCSFHEMKPKSTCYQASPYQKDLIPSSESVECNICKECKLKAVLFNGSFKSVTKTLEAVYMDLVGPFSTRSS